MPRFGAPPVQRANGRICLMLSVLPLPDGRPSACRLLSRFSPAWKNRPTLFLTEKLVPHGPGSSLRCTRAARPGAPLTCSRCGSPMRILAVITEPEEVRRILRHLVKIGPGRPADPLRGWIRASCNCQSVPFVSAPGDACVLHWFSCASARLPHAS